MKKKPDAEAFAKHLLWHICGLRAEVSNLHRKFAKFSAKSSGHSTKAVQKDWETQCAALHRRLYDDAVRAVGLGPPPSSQAQPPEDRN